MFNIKTSQFARAFNQVFSLIDHKNPTRFSDISFKICDFNLKLICFATGFRGPAIRNIFFTESEKSYTCIALFKNKINEKILPTNFYSLKFISLLVILFSYLINNVYHCTCATKNGYHCTSVIKNGYHCTSTINNVHHCTGVIKTGYQCTSAIKNVYHCTSAMKQCHRRI